MAEAVYFYLFSGIMLAAAWSVVFGRQPIYSVLSLLAAMFCLAGLFVMLGAYVAAALQILLYAGAVLVLFLFAMMLLNLDQQALARLTPFTWLGAGAAVAGVLCVQLMWVIRHTHLDAPYAAAMPGTSVAEIGRLLFTVYLLPFELTSFLMLAAIVGAITLAKTKHSD